MPFTPLHMGPGMAFKAAAPRHFSIIVFGLAQIAIDMEVLCHMLRKEYPFHTFWHTYLGVTIVAVILAILGKPISQWMKMVWNKIASQCCESDLSVSVETTWMASIAGAMVGAYSHILLDSVFHADIEPLQPWSATNRLFGLLSSHTIEITCLILGVSGLVCFFWRIRRARNS